MIAQRMPMGGTIGIFCPSHVADPAVYSRITSALTRLGFNVKFGANVYADGYGYAASAKERADDFHALIADDEVRLILFGGGESAVELLPLIDYDCVGACPKLICSYSDGTSILNAIHAKTGLVTYYGTSPGMFEDLRHYNYMQFLSHFIEGYEAKEFKGDSECKTICGGSAQGTLIGGYTSLFSSMLSNRHFAYDKHKRYLLFLEDHERYSSVGVVATWLGYIGQSAFMQHVDGLLFGHYAEEVPDELLHCLERFGKSHGIPVVYTDDFGHGTRHGILPIGMSARFDADRGELVFLDR